MRSLLASVARKVTGADVVPRSSRVGWSPVVELAVSILLGLNLHLLHGPRILRLALNLQHHLLLLNPLICQLLLQLVVHHGQLLVHGCEGIDD